MFEFNTLLNLIYFIFMLSLTAKSMFTSNAVGCHVYLLAGTNAIPGTSSLLGEGFLEPSA